MTLKRAVACDTRVTNTKLSGAYMRPGHAPHCTCIVQVEVENLFKNDAESGEGRKEAKVFTHDRINRMGEQ